VNWTTDKPTKPGVYWYRKNRASVSNVELCCVQYVRYPGQRHQTIESVFHVTKFGRTKYWSINEFDGEWAGPIEPPK
jgi:hypothetical protein